MGYYRNGKLYDLLPKTLPTAQAAILGEIRPQKTEKIWRESDLRKGEPKIVQAKKTPILGLDKKRKVEKFVPPAENFLQYHGKINQASYLPKGTQ
jgi:hypothetical protein